MKNLLSLQQKLKSKLDLKTKAPSKETPKIDLKIGNYSTDELKKFTSNWEENVLKAYTIFKTTQDKKEKAWAFLETIQQMINFGALGQAESFAEKNYSHIKDEISDEQEEIAFLAEYMFKLGWLYDYKGQPQKSIEKLENGLKTLHKLKDLNVKLQYLEGDFYHFLGRSYVLASISEQNVQDSLNSAKQNFEKNLGIMSTLQKTDSSKEYDNIIGFVHLWLAKVSIYSGDLKEVQKNLGDVESRWALKTDESNAGYTAHYKLVMGMLSLAEDNVSKAKSYFDESIELRKTVAPFSKGLAIAYYGLAICAMLENDLGKSQDLINEAVENYPDVLKRGLV